MTRRVEMITTTTTTAALPRRRTQTANYCSRHSVLRGGWGRGAVCGHDDRDIGESIIN